MADTTVEKDGDHIIITMRVSEATARALPGVLVAGAKGAPEEDVPEGVFDELATVSDAIGNSFTMPIERIWTGPGELERTGYLDSPSIPQSHRAEGKNWVD